MVRAPILALLAGLATATACTETGRGRDADRDSGSSAASGNPARPSAQVTDSSCAPALWTGVIDTSAATSPRVTRHRVNRGTNGMFSQIRWTHSPDRCALLVVQDPAAVEAEPVPNGFLHVSEKAGRVFQRDSVWDVAPSPDWKRLAFATAHGAQPRGPAESLSTAEWRRLAQRVRAGVPAVRRSAFSCSGMTYWFCVSRLHATALTDSGHDSATRDPVYAATVLAGWKVRWRDDSTILAGTGPRGSQDHDPPSSWLVVRARNGRIADTLPVADSTAATPRWSEGPMLTYGVAVDMTTPSELPIDGGVIRSEMGWIDVRWPGAGSEQSFRVGAGRALAATRGGRFIAAIVPTGATTEREWAYEVVVFEIHR